MKRHCLIGILFALTLSVHAQTSQWKKVAALEEQSLPQSALAVVDTIYRKALKTGNSPELIQAIIYRLKYQTAIDNDRLPEQIIEIEKFTASDSNSVEQALLYSLLAEIYTNYHQANAYQIRQRTSLAISLDDAQSEIPDMREWTSNVFFQKVNYCIARSMQAPLADQPLMNYKDILLINNASKFYSTLFDFVCQQGIQTLTAWRNQSDKDQWFNQLSSLYQQWLAVQSPTKKPQALVMISLDYADFMRENAPERWTDDDYITALQSLESKVQGKDVCAEICYRKALFYHRHHSNEAQAAEYRTKAYDICRQGIKTYPNYERIGLLKNLLTELTQSRLTVSSDNTVYPGKALALKIQYQNIHRLKVDIYKIAEPVSVYENTWSRNGRYKQSGKLVSTKDIALTFDFPYQEVDTTIQIPVQGVGNYEYVISTDHTNVEPANEQFSVSRLATVSRVMDEKREFLVVDRMSGNPLEGASVRFYQRKKNVLQWQPAQTITTNQLGLATGGNDKDLVFYNASFGNDSALITSSLPWLSTYREQNNYPVQVNLFTDRSIYRPGQTVYFKGIAFKTGDKVQQVIPNQTYTVIFRDANRNEIDKKRLTTNAFGSFSGEFIVPQGLMNGNFLLQTVENGGNANIKVEEYKRPSFDIQFEENNTACRFGDEVVVKGRAKTFSGVELQSVPVQYRITRQYHWLCRSRYFEPVQVAVGTVQTQDDGSFEIRFTPEKTLENRNDSNVYYTYIIETTLTNTNGETQSASNRMSIGDTSMYFAINGLTGVVNKEDMPAVQINALNLSGHPVPVAGSYSVYALRAKDAAQFDLRDEDWLVDNQVFSGRFEAGKELDMAGLKALPSGRYRICLAADSLSLSWKITGGETDFTLASQADKRPPVPVYQWLMTPKTTCAVSEKAEIIYGSSAKGVSVLYELFQNNKRLSVARFVLNNSNQKLSIPFLQSYGDGITATFSFVKDGKFFTETVEIRKKQEDKALTLKMEVFRDRLQPGQKEEWKLSVKDATHAPAISELLAGMYDASLDQITQHSWSFQPVQPVYLWKIYPQKGNEFNISNRFIAENKESVAVPDFSYNSFNWFGFAIANQSRANVLRATVANTYKGVDIVDLEDHKIVVQENAVAAFKSMESKIEAQTDQPEPLQLRQNFNETAFFYPHLMTNEAGETLISFTVPESNTTWKFLGLAHTKDLKYGSIMQQVVSQKKLMLAPNMPRFMREGDQITLTANISNLTETTLAGTVSIECFDPLSNQSNIMIAEALQTFSVEAGKTVPVNWMFNVPSGIDLTAVKIIARTPDFSDGEQHLIPVLPNRMLVTESLPLHIAGGQSRTYSLNTFANKTSSTLQDYRWTLELASNPVWYAVQALPSMTTPQSDNVLDWFASYYSNTLATQIANSTPKIKQVIDVWTKQGGTKETLLSNLEKNQELKSVLLEETPWVLEASNESEQKQRLSLLFDLNRAANFQKQAVDKLQALQLPDGGWSWFKNMDSNVGITQWILYGISRLGTRENHVSTIASAIAFIDNQFQKQFESLKKNRTDWKQLQTLSTYELEYLFVRSLYKDIPLGDNEAAVRFYTSVLEKYWAKTPNLYNRALSAMILQREGHEKTAQSILNSLREHATRKPDLGMFWANNTITNCFMTQSAVCVHTFIMEAFNEIDSTPQEMDEMKVWLLKQKQTQLWENVPATVNAINIVLQTGTNWLESDDKPTIQIDKQALDIPVEAATGYFKTELMVNPRKPLKEITIAQANNIPAFGALYHQYYETIDRINASQTSLSISKQLFIEKNTPAGKTLQVITAGTPIKTGNKVTVRLTVRTDRDLEFVCLKDMRASCFEPSDQLSGTQWKQGLLYYLSPKDASMNFFFSAMSKGTYVFEYHLYATASGDYSNGTTSIQCLYAPEFVSHTAGGRVIVE
ncbi:MAG: hypothetical protein EZS26_000589 [Candidatus Ordinivivax streblomastigis]|uniref:Alpha-2-macroglobulin domain-containing protein n=1 Tax=Candidatus Ordinivivax streblomastigis TaxID=2540710 RepID=A0A5M8P4A6_9BACT|nr:MAG: hypothetical protein EZS26_000378 [Candidatus Ordinivivax streblomastigis]KAA6303429.1 MAG: hypothetical protein EZS26_000589 [Candidatus Ordinivivax streblomastigis]